MGYKIAFERRLNGVEQDLESGLDYFGARFYDSVTGRFLSPDPLLDSANPGDPQKWNRYHFTRNNPIRFIDPDGREEIEFIVRTFIPQAFVLFPVAAIGDNRNIGEKGGFRTEQRITIETDPAKRPGRGPVTSYQSADTGISIGMKANPPLPVGIGKSSGSTLKADAVDTDGAVELTISGNEAFPLVPSPGITFDFKLTVPTDASRVDISGSHDGFPAFEIFAVTENGELNLIFSFDPRETDQTLFSLFPPMEFTASESVQLEEDP